MMSDLPEVKQFKLSNGKKGNHQTISVMKKLARERSGHPLVRKTAVDILNQYQVASQDYVTEAYVIGNWVKENVAYVRDPDNIEYLQDPLTILENVSRGVARGDCDDMATLAATLLLAIGHRPAFRAVRYESHWGNYNHIYVVVYEKNWGKPTQRLVIDCILKRSPIGTEVKHKNGNEFPA